MKKKIFTLVALFACALGASAANTVTVKSVEMAPGAQAKVNLELTNDVAFKGYSFSLTLPTGVSAVTETRQLPTELNATPTDQEVVKVEFTDRQAAANFYVFSKVDGQKVNFFVLPNPSAVKAIEAGTGVIMSVFVTVPDGTAVTGTPYDESIGAIGDIVFTEGTADTPVDGNNSLKFDTYRLGDANGDGTVDVADANAILNDIVDNTPANFIEAAANANKNEDGVEVGDANKVLNFVVGNIAVMAPKVVTPVVNEDAQINEPD